MKRTYVNFIWDAGFVAILFWIVIWVAIYVRPNTPNEYNPACHKAQAALEKIVK